jgi:hypothetical protein
VDESALKCRASPFGQGQGQGHGLGHEKTARPVKKGKNTLELRVARKAGEAVMNLKKVVLRPISP